ncbi:MAG: hypothetical protein ACLSIL_06740 [Enterococcus casseliflavus]|nr:hypothetical protein D922_02750 [Enterococcus faecalis 06-MB-DW-09]
MQNGTVLKRIYFNDKQAIVVDDSAGTYCFVSDSLGIMKVKDMIGYFIFHEDLPKKEKELNAKEYQHEVDMIEKYPKL